MFRLLSAAIVAVSFTLISVAAARAEDGKYQIQLSDINKSTANTPLKDHDWIELVETKNPRMIPEDQVLIVLRFGPKVTWWKGILLFEKDGVNQFKRVVEGESKNAPFKALINVNDLRKYDLLLSKAKAFGVHANMYKITDAATAMKGGHAYTFTWLQD